MAAANPDLDLVLLDLALPGMSGFGLIGRLHERFPSLPVVVLSALEDPENVRQTINSGAMGFVPKSAPTRVLLEVLQQVLEGNVSVPARRFALPSNWVRSMTSPQDSTTSRSLLFRPKHAAVRTFSNTVSFSNGSGT